MSPESRLQLLRRLHEARAEARIARKIMTARERVYQRLAEVTEEESDEGSYASERS